MKTQNKFPARRQIAWQKNSIIFLLLLLFAGLANAQTPADNGYPLVRLDYGFVPFDRTCSKITDSEIKEEWIAELQKRLPEFQKLWDTEGPRIMETIIEETGVRFEQREMQVTLTLCKFPSMSHPLLVNARRFLNSFSDEKPRPLFMFTALVVHELLHNYSYNILENAPLRQKYSQEPFSVQSHIYLMALMKMAYLKLGLESELAAIIENNVRYGGVYKRAWEIVNDIEGYQAFVDEIKQFAPVVKK